MEIKAQIQSGSTQVVVVASDGCFPIELRTTGRMREDGILEVEYPFLNADGSPIAATSENMSQIDFSHIIYPDGREEKIDTARMLGVLRKNAGASHAQHFFDAAEGVTDRKEIHRIAAMLGGEVIEDGHGEYHDPFVFPDGSAAAFDFVKGAVQVIRTDAGLQDGKNEDPISYSMVVRSNTTYGTDTVGFRVFPGQDVSTVADRIASGYGAIVESIASADGTPYLCETPVSVVNNDLTPTEWKGLGAKELVRRIESAGFSVSGPCDVRAAEHGEPVWVCNARTALAEVISAETKLACLKAIKMVVLCRNSDGAPEFHTCEVEVNQAQYDNGDHYTLAEKDATNNGFEAKLAFDEKDPAAKQIGEIFFWL